MSEGEVFPLVSSAGRRGCGATTAPSSISLAPSFPMAPSPVLLPFSFPALPGSPSTLHGSSSRRPSCLRHLPLHFLPLSPRPFFLPSPALPAPLASGAGTRAQGPDARRGRRMALAVLRLALLLLAVTFAGPLFRRFSKYKTPFCARYQLPGCPRDFNPVCGTDMITYPNECTLCMKIRESGQNIKIFRRGPC
uniref:Kazal-like domain-containing protein n=2 Tax=Papio anubis TaxID=9555 RepID=A0A8I5NJW8_PAPAN